MIPEKQIDPETIDGDGIFFEIFLVPHRSLPPVGFLAVMAVLIGLSVAIGVGFTIAGAWPVISFLGLDIVLVYAAFRISYRAACRSERVRLTAQELEVVFLDGADGGRRAVLEPYWARVDLAPVNRKHTRLVLRSHGRALELGSFLGAEEKVALAETLTDALHQWRNRVA
ncbi:MAG: DUF2244 domain-containing protein [Proteobacteria bacterium]|nr:DUF2244 domain-containing protein [Pseudomonadota bacterium]